MLAWKRDQRCVCVTLFLLLWDDYWLNETSRDVNRHNERCLLTSGFCATESRISSPSEVSSPSASDSSVIVGVNQSCCCLNATLISLKITKGSSQCGDRVDLIYRVFSLLYCVCAVFLCSCVDHIHMCVCVCTLVCFCSSLKLQKNCK